MSQYPPNPYEQNPNVTPDGTVYANPPSGGQNPYNPYPGNPPSGPGGNSDPYGAYPPAPPPPGATPNTSYSPYDPNAQTYITPGSNPNYSNYPPTVYQAPPPVVPPQPPAPRRRGPSSMIIVLSVVALVIIVGGILIGFLVVNGQKSSADATATAQANATATAHANASATADAALTATAITNTYPFSTNLVLNDPLTDNSKGSNWQTTASFCQFAGSAYHVSDSQTNTFSACFGTGTHFSNFTFEAEMNISKGDGGGLLFRGNPQTDQLYRVTFFTNGHYGLYVYVDNTGTNARILKYDTYPSGVDLTNTNTVSVVARGSTLTIYLNHTEVTSVTDSTFSSGAIGFSAYDLTNPTEVIFTNAKVWQLSS